MSRILITNLILVGTTVLLLGWKVAENRNLSKKIHQLQNVSQADSPSLESEIQVVQSSSPERASNEERQKSKLLNSLIECCRKHKHPILPRSEFSETFEPNEDLALVLELSSEQMNHLKTLGTQTIEQIHAWEIERTTEISRDGSHIELICEIPPQDEAVLQIKDNFLQGVSDTVGKDNYSLIQYNLGQQFRSLERKRLVTVSTTRDEKGADRYAIEISEFDDSGHITSQRRKGGLLSHKRGINPVPQRYAHLFAIDREEN